MVKWRRADCEPTLFSVMAGLGPAIHTARIAAAI